MQSMRAAYEEFRRVYLALAAIEGGSITDAMLRGAFSAGVMHGLVVAQLGPDEALAAIERMQSQLDEFWQKELPQGLEPEQLESR